MRGSPLRTAHDLAAHLKQPDVIGMLKGMSVHAWRDWQLYMMNAPFGEERADIRTAQICMTIVNMNRDIKVHPQPIPIKEFVLQFGDASEQAPKKVAKPQTVEEMERHITDWVAGTNQVIREERQRGILDHQ